MSRLRDELSALGATGHGHGSVNVVVLGWLRGALNDRRLCVVAIG